MSISQIQRIGLIAGAVLVAAISVYFIASGARPGGPLVFAAFAAAALAGSMWLLLRTGAALVFEPPADEVKVVSGRRRKELEREKQLILKALKELEFDFEMKKISEGDYKEIASVYRARAVRVMRQLDESDLDYRKMVERDVHARIADKAGAAEKEAT